MPQLNDFLAKGQLLSSDGTTARLAITGFNYELELASTAVRPPGTLVCGVIRAKARKVLTIPTGGNFVQPIFGSPKVIQGRIRYVEGNTLVVQAGTLFHVELPTSDDAIDLNNGSLSVGCTINATIFPGAALTLVDAPVPVPV
jgi:hypothetical protein